MIEWGRWERWTATEIERATKLAHASSDPNDLRQCILSLAEVASVLVAAIQDLNDRNSHADEAARRLSAIENGMDPNC